MSKKNKKAKEIVNKLSYSEKYGNTSNRIKLQLDSVLIGVLISDYLERKDIDKAKFFDDLKEKLKIKYQKEIEEQIDVINSDETLSMFWDITEMNQTVQVEEKIFNEVLNEIINSYKNL